MRAGSYHWSDDWGRTWQPLEGIPDIGPEVYQPWIHCLPDGRIACAGHYGRDAPIRGEDRDNQYISLHLFRVEVLRWIGDTKIRVERDFEPQARRWRNTYTLTLLCGDDPLPGKNLEFWYVEKNQPGYNSFGRQTLAERMAQGGHLLRVCTDADGRARLDLSHLDAIEDTHHSIQFVARFNTDGTDPAYKPYQTDPSVRVLQHRVSGPTAVVKRSDEYGQRRKHAYHAVFRRLVRAQL